MIKGVKFAFVFVGLLVGIFLSVYAVLASSPFYIITSSNSSSSMLIEGKNNVSFLEEFYVKDLVIYNPEIEAVSYTDPFSSEAVGFVNVFGGIGKNFLVQPGTEYEVIVSRNVSLSLG